MFTMAVGTPNGQVYYVLPQGTSNSSCPHDGNLCTDINTYAQNVRKYFLSNTTFIFLPGNHFLEIKDIIEIQAVDKLNLVSNGSFKWSSIANDCAVYNFDQYNDDSNVTYKESLANITCTGSSGFSFFNVTNLSLINITITNCGVYSLQTSLNASIHLVNVSGLLMQGVTIKNSTGYGLLGVNVQGQSTIMKSSFIGNNQIIKDIYMFKKNSVKSKCNNILTNSSFYSNYESSSCVLNGGNIYLNYQDPVNNNSESNELMLTDLVLSLGVDGSYPHCLTSSPGTGLAVVMQQQTYSVHIIINYTISYRNQGNFGANFYFQAISGSVININYVTSKSGVSIHGSMYYTVMSSSNVHSNTSLFIVNHSAFECNYAPECGSLYVHIPGYISHHVKIYLENSCFVDDTTLTNRFISVTSTAGHLSMYILHCYFKNLNPVTNNYGILAVLGNQDTSIWVDNSYQMYTELFCESADVYVTNSIFFKSRVTAVNSSIILNGNVCFKNVSTNRNGGAMLILSSKLIINELAEVIFAYNYATYGGALYIDQSSSMHIISPSNISFISNSASLAGGAIYVQSSVPSSYMQSQCFFQFQATINLSVVMYFEGNYAGEAGSVLYGGNIDNCTLDCTNIPHQYHDRCMNSSGTIFDMITDVGYHLNFTSLIASDPTTLCYCNQSHELKCSNSDPKDLNVHVSRYPGEKFSKSLTAHGQRDGIVPGIVYTWYFENEVIITSAFRTSKQCAVFDIPFFNHDVPYIGVTTAASFNSIVEIMESFYYNLTLLPCPIGFCTDNVSSICNCNEELQNHGLKCDINDQSVSWISGAKWVGKVSNDTIGIIDNCPSDYCNDITTVSLHHPDMQCKYNRSGILCGQCQDDLSMMLGSPQCSSKCSNHYLLLLIPFAVMGVALVGFIVMFNFTVSNGTINSLVLYAFIINLNRNIFFPLSCNPIVKYLLSPFIAWLNLDLGIATCFYKHMDSTGNVWLQFVFSVYLSVIILTILGAVMVSSKISRVCRYHLFPVIATLMVLLHSKLVRTVLIIFTYAHMDASNSTYLLVWSYDGNVEYLSAKHKALFIVGLLVTILLIVPYTLLIPLTPFLVKLSHLRVFSLINKVKPIIDSYEAPFKERYRFWTGAMLIYRIALTIVSTYFSQQPDMVLLVIIVVHSCIVFSGFAIYKSWIISTMETTLHVNIIITSLAIYFWPSDRNYCVPTSVGVSAALVCFLAIVIRNIITSALGWKLCHMKYLKQPNSEANDIQQASAILPSGNNEYRELLMDD